MDGLERVQLQSAIVRQALNVQQAGALQLLPTPPSGPNPGPAVAMEGVEDLLALELVGRVHVEEERLGARGLDLPDDPLDVGHRALAVEMDAADVHAAAGELEGRRFAEAAGGAEDQGPLAFEVAHGGRV